MVVVSNPSHLNPAVLANENLSSCLCSYYHHAKSRAIAEAISGWLPTAAARVRARVWPVVFVVDKLASSQVFSEYFSFPCQNRSFHQLLHPHNHPGQVQ
jgi:hypothetical protein